MQVLGTYRIRRNDGTVIGINIRGLKKVRSHRDAMNNHALKWMDPVDRAKIVANPNHWPYQVARHF